MNKGAASRLILDMLKCYEFYTVMEENWSNHSINLIPMTTFLNHGCKILRCVPIVLEVQQNQLNRLCFYDINDALTCWYHGRLKFSINCLMTNQIITPFYYSACTFEHSKITVTCVSLDPLNKRPLMTSSNGGFQQ